MYVITDEHYGTLSYYANQSLLLSLADQVEAANDEELEKLPFTNFIIMAVLVRTQQAKIQEILAEAETVVAPKKTIMQKLRRK